MGILSGYKNVKDRILTSDGFKLLSRWTSSNSIEFNDGSTAEEKVGGINGISSSSTATATNIASSIGYVNQSFDSKLGGCSLQVEDDGAYVTYTSTEGTKVKKKLGSGTAKSVVLPYTATEDALAVAFCANLCKLKVVPAETSVVAIKDMTTGTNLVSASSLAAEGITYLVNPGSAVVNLIKGHTYNIVAVSNVSASMYGTLYIIE